MRYGIGKRDRCQKRNVVKLRIIQTVAGYAVNRRGVYAKVGPYGHVLVEGIAEIHIPRSPNAIVHAARSRTTKAFQLTILIKGRAAIKSRIRAGVRRIKIKKTGSRGS